MIIEVKSSLFLTQYLFKSGNGSSVLTLNLGCSGRVSVVNRRLDVTGHRPLHINA